MKLWRLSQGEKTGYDTHDSCVVAAPDESAARRVHPSSVSWEGDFSTWASSPEGVRAEYLGEAKDGTPTGLILASFNAG